MSVLIVYTTVATAEQAREIAQALVEQGLAACAQVEPIESWYRWQGAMAHDTEVRLLFKTSSERYPELERELRARHPYELPAIYALAAERAEPAFAAWVEQESRAPR